MATVTDPNVSYAIGSSVWVKIYNRIWWPGLVVDETSIPADLKEFKEGLKESIAVVKFINEEKYEVVQVKDKISLYSCEQKIQYIQRGISLSKLQKKGQKIVGNCNMDNFFEDIRSMESYIEGGDVNIIQNIEIQQEERKKLVKELFTPSSLKKPKKKVEGRRSLPAPKPVIPSKIIKTPSKMLKPEPQLLRRSNLDLKSTVSKKSTPIETNSGATTRSSYKCYSNCNYTTKSFDILKRHMLIHEIKTKEEKSKKTSSPISKKRKNLITKSPDTKKQKCQEDLLNIDTIDKNVVSDTSNVPTTTCKLVNEYDSQHIIKNLDSGSSIGDVVNESFERKLTSDFINHVIFDAKPIDNSTELTNKIYDQTNNTELLLENTKSTSCHMLKLEQPLSGISTGINKSNANVNVIDTHKETDGGIESQNKDIVFDTSNVVPTKMGLVQATNEVEVTINNVLPTQCKPSNKETHTIDSNENDISSISICPTKVVEEAIRDVLINDDQTKSAELLLEDADSTLDNTCKLEESLEAFSISVNNVIDTQKMTDGIENQNIWIKNSEMVESEKTADDLVIIDTDIIPNENVSKSSNMDTSEEIMIESNDWMKQHGWEIITVQEIKQAKYFYNFTVTERLPNISNLKPFGPELWISPEITFNKCIDEKTLNTYPQLLKIFVPRLKKATIENIKSNPNFKALLKAAEEGKTLIFEYTGDNPIIAEVMPQLDVKLPEIID